MGQRIELSSNGTTVSVELTSLSVTNNLVDELPLESHISTWGDEIYFPIPVEAEPGSLTQDVKVGDVAFWHEGQSLAIFFGPTPMSGDDDKPVPADDVEVIGEVTSGLDQLGEFNAGQSINVRSVS